MTDGASRVRRCHEVLVHRVTAPTALDSVLAVPDAGKRLDALTDYLARLDAQARRARQARLDAVLRLRAGGMKWRDLAAQTGLTETHLRGICRGKDVP